MNKRVAVSAGVVAAVAGAWAGSTLYVGQRVEKTLLAQLAPLQAQPAPGQSERVLRVTGVQYDRSLLGATRTVNLAMGCGDKSAQFSWRDDIRHGPLPGFAGVGAARIVSQLVLSDAQKQQWKALTGQDQPAMSLVTQVALSGALQSQLDVPALQLKMADGGLLELEKMQAQVKLDARGRAQYFASLPAYHFSAPLGEGRGLMRVSMRDMQLNNEGLAPAWWAFSGKGEGRVGSLEVALQPAEGAVQPLFALQDLRYTQEGSLKDGLYSANMQMQGKGNVAGLALDALSMKVRMDRLHGDTYAAFVQHIYAATCPVEGADPKAEAEKMLAGMASLLPHNPGFSVDEFQITLGGHSAKLAYGVSVQGVTAEELKAPSLVPVLMQKTVAQAELDVALPLVTQVAAAMGKPLPAEVLDQALAAPMAQGLLLREGERVRTKLEWRNGMAALNGKPMPLPGMPAPAAAPYQ